jgi:hypothetical protein
MYAEAELEHVAVLREELRNREHMAESLPAPAHLDVVVGVLERAVWLLRSRSARGEAALERARALHSPYFAKKRQTGIRAASNWCRKPQALPFMHRPRSQCRHTVCVLRVSKERARAARLTRHAVVLAPSRRHRGRRLHRLSDRLLQAALKVEWLHR